MRGFTTQKRLDGSIPDRSFDRLIMCIQRQGLLKASHLRPHAWLLLLGCHHPQHDDIVQAARSDEARTLYIRFHSLAKETDTAAAVYANMGGCEPWERTLLHINNDINRMSCSGGPFSCPETRPAASERLHSLLTAFALYQPAIGYCQGLHDCAAPFLEVFEEDWKAFWCFRQLMCRVGCNFKEGFVSIQQEMTKVSVLLATIDPALSRHLHTVDAGDCRFCFQMLLLLFRREVPWPQLLVLWESMWAYEAKTQCSLHVEVAVAMLQAHRKALLECQDFGDVVMLTSRLPPTADVLQLTRSAFRMWAMQHHDFGVVGLEYLNSSDSAP